MFLSTKCNHFDTVDGQCLFLNFLSTGWKNTGPCSPHLHPRPQSLLDIPDVKDVAAKWERSNMNTDIYYMCWNQMEAKHSSQHHVTEVTPAPHEKPVPLPSVSAGLCRCLQQPGLPALQQPAAALMIPTSPRPAVTERGYFSKLLLLSIFLLGGCGDIKAAAGRRRAFLTLAPSFISLFHRPRHWQWKDFTTLRAETHSTSHPSCSALQPLHWPNR